MKIKLAIDNQVFTEINLATIDLIYLQDIVNALFDDFYLALDFNINDYI